MSAIIKTAFLLAWITSSAGFGFPIDKPLHALQVDTINCGIKVLVNGVTVLANEEIHSASTLVRINEWLQRGNNKLAVEAQPMKEEPNIKRNIQCNVTGVVSQSGQAGFAGCSFQKDGACRIRKKQS